jgi:hypothetical protein
VGLCAQVTVTSVCCLGTVLSSRLFLYLWCLTGFVNITGQQSHPPHHKSRREIVQLIWHEMTSSLAWARCLDMWTLGRLRLSCFSQKSDGWEPGPSSSGLYLSLVEAVMTSDHSSVLTMCAQGPCTSS